MLKHRVMCCWIFEDVGFCDILDTGGPFRLVLVFGEATEQKGYNSFGMMDDVVTSRVVPLVAHWGTEGKDGNAK